MHTVNNLLQTLNYVKQFQYSVIKHKFMQNAAYLIRKGQNRKSQKSNLGSIMFFSEVMFISCVMLSNKNDIWNKKCMKLTMCQT